MPDILDDDASQGPGPQMFSLARLRADLRRYYLLLCTLIAIFLAAGIAYVAVKEPAFTATAIVGPADNSDLPISPDLAGAQGGSLGGIAKHLHAGGMLGQQGVDNTFDEYSSLLTSNRLLDVLVRKDHFLQQMFAADWDPVHQRWLKHDDFLHRSIDYGKIILHRPVHEAPDQDDLQKYFEQHLIVDPSLETSFATVSFRFRTPEGAERLLGTILREADNIIREDKRRDVAARIAFLNTALEHLSLTDQKQELIDILSAQEQEMMIIESDHSYASTLIDMPYAPLKPSSPSPVEDSAIALGLACLAWLGMVRIAAPESRWSRLLSPFERPRRNRRREKRRTHAPEDLLADALRIPSSLDVRGGTTRQSPG